MFLLKKIPSLISIGFYSLTSASAEVLEVSDSISLHGTEISTTIDGVTTTSNVVRTNSDGTINTSSIYDTSNQNPGLASTGAAYEYGIRGRLVQAQLDRRFRSFLQFDVSGIPAEELASPFFNATFSVDYVGNLNSLNSGFRVELGQITEGAWNSTDNLPTFDLSENSVPLTTLIQNVSLNSTAQLNLTFDITALVLAWADGSVDNFGLTFTSDETISNGGYFSNATIETSTTPTMMDTLTVSESLSLHGAPIETTIDGVTTSSNTGRTNLDGTINNDPSIYSNPAESPGISSTDQSYQYAIRERTNFTDPQRRFRSFLRFDVSGLSAQDVADPSFSASFTVDYVGNLNSSNFGYGVSLGQITTSDWNTTDDLPVFGLSESSTDLGSLIDDVAANPIEQSGLTLDITQLVRGWVDGSVDNFGLTFTGVGMTSNAAYFNNATIEITRPLSTLKPPAPEFTSITRAANGEVSLTFTSTSGNVDIFRSTDLLDFGGIPIATDIAPGSYLDSTATNLPTAFYMLAPTAP